jgi:hypothetical protein
MENNRNHHWFGMLNNCCITGSSTSTSGSIDSPWNNMTLKEHSVSLRNTVNINGVLNYLKQLCDPTNHSLSRIVVIFHLISGYIHYEVITETSQFLLR